MDEATIIPSLKAGDGRKSVYTARFCDRLDEIGETVWENLFPASCENYGYFKTVEETLSSQFKFSYLLLLREGSPVCIAPCFAYDYPLITTVEGFLKGPLSWLMNRFPRVCRPRTLFCGSPTGEGRLGMGERIDRELLPDLLAGLESLAQRESADVVLFKDFPSRFRDFLELSVGYGFCKIKSYPWVSLPLGFETFEDYLGSLSRATRKDLKRKFRNAAHAKVSFEVASQPGDALDEICALYQNTYLKSDVRFETIPREFFLRLPENSPGRTVYFLWRLRGKLVAFDLCVVHNGTLIDEYIGFDYSVAYDLHLYYTTFRDIVVWCLKNGVKEYRSGALNYEPKKRLDFEFNPLDLYFKHSHPGFQRFFRILAQFLKPENFDPVLRELSKKQAKLPREFAD